MDILSIIEKKKNKIPLSSADIDFFIKGYTQDKSIKDYQASALLMAINLNGMNDEETYHLTKAILASGSTIDLHKISGFKIDKHSTGGVGDKVSLILAPICAALGIRVAKLSGRGLGHTGGTIDKLESIGVNCYLDKKHYMDILAKQGLFIVAQSEDIVPADRLLYDLRNATNTVQSIPLIAASVVAKKLALKTDCVFLDVKVGDGGFCKTIAKATALSNLMLSIFKRFKRKVIIDITNMTQPLGRAIGNAIEVKAAIDYLSGHPESKEIEYLINHFIIDILLVAKKAKNHFDAQNQINRVIDSKQALNKFFAWVKAQGANMRLLDNGRYFNPKYQHKILASKSGFVDYLSTKTIAMTSFYLGAGRLVKGNPIDFQAGLWLNKIKNEYVEKGGVIATLYSSKPIKKEVITHFINNLKYNNTPTKPEKVIMKVVK